MQISKSKKQQFPKFTNVIYAGIKVGYITPLLYAKLQLYLINILLFRKLPY